MGIIGGFIGLIRWLGIKNLLIIIFGTALFFIGKSYLKKREIARMPIETLFKEIKYVQELRLVTYYYDELLDVGTSDRLENLVNQAEAELIVSRQRFNAARFFRDRTEEAMLKAQRQFEESKHIKSTNETLKQLRQEIKTADSLHNLHKILLFVNVAERLEADDSIFGDEIARLYAKYKRIDLEIKTKKKADGTEIKRGVLKTLKKEDRPNAKKEVMTAFNARKKSLKENVEKLESVYKETEDAILDSRQSLRGIKNLAEKDFRKAEKDLAAALKDTVDKWRYLSRAELELEAKKQEGKEAPPNMLVIASAEATGYIDLKQLEFDFFDDDSVTVKNMPKAKLDSIVIDLPTNEKRYIVGNAKPKLNESSVETGIYFEVYKQLKEAISEAKERVKARAHDAGILDDTEEMARQYIVDFGKSMGYGVGFSLNPTTDSLENAKAVESEEIQAEAEALRDSLELEDAINAADSIAKVQVDSANIPEPAPSN